MARVNVAATVAAATRDQLTTMNEGEKDEERKRRPWWCWRVIGDSVEWMTRYRRCCYYESNSTTATNLCVRGVWKRSVCLYPRRKSCHSLSCLDYFVGTKCFSVTHPHRVTTDWDFVRQRGHLYGLYILSENMPMKTQCHDDTDDRQILNSNHDHVYSKQYGQKKMKIA